MKAKLTPWFPPEVKPVRPGVYISTITKQARFYRLWDGLSWHYGSKYPECAANIEMLWSDYISPLHWRGLAKEPK